MKFFVQIVTAILFMSSSIAIGQPMVKRHGQPPQGGIDVTPFAGHLVFRGIALGVTGGYRLLPRGFIPPINNSVSVEGSLLQCFNDGEPCTDLAIHGRWEFHVHQRWSPYAAIGFRLGTASDNSRDDIETLFLPDVKFGTFFRADEGHTFKFEVIPSLSAHLVGYVFFLD